MSTITKPAQPTKTTSAIQHPGEAESNDARRRLGEIEPISLRTFTPSQVVIETAAGSYLWTRDGRKLADFTSGVLVSNLGHNPTRWWKRVIELMQLDALKTAGEYTPAVPLTAYNAVTDLEVQASERLIANLQAAPGGAHMEQVMWSASGSEAVQKALWACLKFQPGRDLILATRFGFHGKKGLAGACTGSENDAERDPRVKFISFPMEECSNLAKRKQPLDLTKYRQELDELAAKHAGKIACLITEPYLGGGGSYHPQKEYLQLLQEFCRQHNIIFILDEIQANFGRTGPMYAFTHYGLEPDIVTLGKGLGNGVPVSAAVGRADVMAALKYGEASDTWSANPLSSAAVIATLDEYETDDIIGQGLELAKVIEAGLTSLVETGLIVNVRGEGCVWGIECTGAGGKTPAEVANAIVEACYLGDDQGRAIHLLGPLAGKVIRISPPLTMKLDDASEYFAAMKQIVGKLASGLK